MKQVVFVAWFGIIFDCDIPDILAVINIERFCLCTALAYMTAHTAMDGFYRFQSLEPTAPNQPRHHPSPPPSPHDYYYHHHCHHHHQYHRHHHHRHRTTTTVTTAPSPHHHYHHYRRHQHHHHHHRLHQALEDPMWWWMPEQPWRSNEASYGE